MEQEKTFEENHPGLKGKTWQQTTFSHICWDDGDLWYNEQGKVLEEHERHPHGDWSESAWQEKIKDFNPEWVRLEDVAATQIDKQRLREVLFKIRTVGADKDIVLNNLVDFIEGELGL